MHALPLLALAATAFAQSVTVYSDSACKHAIQTIHFADNNVFQCAEFTNMNAQGAMLSKTGFTNKGYNVWDSDYCAGDMVGGLPQYLGTCLSAPYFGLAAFKSAHISPRNATGDGIPGGVLPVPL